MCETKELLGTMEAYRDVCTTWTVHFCSVITRHVKYVCYVRTHNTMHVNMCSSVDKENKN